MASATKIAKDLEKELSDLIDTLKKKVSKAELDSIGDVAINEMKNLISKGISPIEGKGRFPEYKAAGSLKGAKATSKGLRDALRVGAGKGANDRGIRAALSQSTGNEKQAKLGYPYSVQKKYPKKRARPVNLELSGDMLDHLTKRSNAAEKSVEIGFYDQKSIKKELGHREGANTQPLRPIIPKANESLAQSIRVKIERAVQAIIDKINR